MFQDEFDHKMGVPRGYEGAVVLSDRKHLLEGWRMYGLVQVGAEDC